MKVSNLKVTPAVVAPGEKITVSFTVKRESGDTFKRELWVGGTEYIDTMYKQPFDLAKGKSANVSFEYTVNLTEGMDLYQYLQQHRYARDTKLFVQFGSGGTNVEVNIPDGITVLDARYSPAIRTFDFVRCVNGLPDDEGSQLKMEIAIAAAASAKTQNMGLKLYFADGAEVDVLHNYIDFSASISTLLGFDAPYEAIIAGSYTNASSWTMVMQFGDEFEQAISKRIVPRSFVNVDIAALKTGGVCFGGFSKSTEGNPMFESHYPAHLYGGIAQIGGGWTELAVINASTPGEYGGGKLRCRKMEKKCIIAGSVQVKPGNSAVTIAMLPEGYVPRETVYALNACSGQRVARIRAADDGSIAVEWVINIDDGSKHVSDAIWVQCSMEYWID